MSNPNRFKIYEKSNVVVDFQHCLMWQRDIRIATWEEADKTAKSSNLSGFSDWRLPTIEELQTLLEGIPEGQTEGEFLKGKGEYGFYWSRGLWNLEGKYHPETKEVDDDKKTPASGEKSDNAHCDTSKSDDSEPNNGMWLDDNLDKKIWTDSFFWSGSDYDEWKEKQKSKDDIDIKKVKTKPEKPAESGSNTLDDKEIKLTVSKTEFKAGMFFSNGKISCSCKDSKIPKYYFCVRTIEKTKDHAGTDTEKILSLTPDEVLDSKSVHQPIPRQSSKIVIVPKEEKSRNKTRILLLLLLLLALCLFVHFKMKIGFFAVYKPIDENEKYVEDVKVDEVKEIKLEDPVSKTEPKDESQAASKTESKPKNEPQPKKEIKEPSKIPKKNDKKEPTTKCGRKFRKNGKIWCDASRKRLGWAEANEYCKRIEEDGKTGWHLPTIDELRMLDEERDLKDIKYWCVKVPGKSTGYWNKDEDNNAPIETNPKNINPFYCVRNNR